MYVTFVMSVSQRTNQPREESPPEGGVTTESADLWCKDTQLFDICQ